VGCLWLALLTAVSLWIGAWRHLCRCHLRLMLRLDLYALSAFLFLIWKVIFLNRLFDLFGKKHYYFDVKENKLNREFKLKHKWFSC
jgi:hypothetical protein